MSWFNILEEARVFSELEESFSLADLVKCLKLKPYVASAWIGKFIRWGYIERIGSTPNPGHKPCAVYRVTKKGFEAEDLSKKTLAKALRAYFRARKALEETRSRDEMQAKRDEWLAYQTLVKKAKEAGIT